MTDFEKLQARYAQLEHRAEKIEKQNTKLHDLLGDAFTMMGDNEKVVNDPKLVKFINLFSK